MKNVKNRQTRHIKTALRITALALALSLGIAPLAMAHSSDGTAPDGADYLLSYGSNYHHSGHSGSGGVGSYGNGGSNVPEPATWGMFGLGLAMIGVGVATRRRRRANLG